MKYTLFVFFGFLCIIELNALNLHSKGPAKISSHSTNNVHTKKETTPKENKGKKESDKPSSSTKTTTDKIKEKIRERIKDKIKDIIPKKTDPGRKGKTTDLRIKTTDPRKGKTTDPRIKDPRIKITDPRIKDPRIKTTDPKIKDPRKLTDKEKQKLLDKLKEKIKEKIKEKMTEQEIKKIIEDLKRKGKHHLTEQDIKKIIDDIKQKKGHPTHPINTDPTMRRIIEELRRKRPINDPVIKNLLEELKKKHKVSDPEMKKIMIDLRKRAKNPVLKPTGPVKQTALPNNKDKEKVQKIIDFLKSKLGCGYAYGSDGQTLTQNLLDQYKKDYGSNVKDSTKQWIGKECYDCSGLTEKALKEVGINVNHNAQATWKHDLKQRGDIKDIPEDKLCLVFKKGSNGTMHHIGIYIGNGKVIEAKGADYGVVETDLKDGHWTNWGMTAGLD